MLIRETVTLFMLQKIENSFILWCIILNDKKYQQEDLCRMIVDVWRTGINLGQAYLLIVWRIYSMHELLNHRNHETPTQQ
jgi:hypothetical protein